MRRFVLYALFLVFPAVAGSQTLGRAVTVGPGNSITIGKVDSIWSPTLKEQRKFLVYTPPSYSDTTYLPQKYPVLYLLDGDANFHSVTGLVQILGTGVNGTYVIPEMIVVGIPNTDRRRDLTPTRATRGFPGMPPNTYSNSGGGPNFFRFLQHELIPRIDSAYRGASYRVLVGHSLGGIAAISALYTIPETFNAYIVIDPSLWYDEMVLLKKAKDAFSRAGLPGRALYMAQANTVTPDDTTVNAHFSSIVQFNRVLETYNRSGLRYGFKYYPDDTHAGVAIIAEYDALRFIFAPYNLSTTVSQQGPSAVVAHFAHASDVLGYRFLPPEQLLDQLGRAALTSDTTKAIDFFRVNAELYPNSPKVFDALGDGWLAKGDFNRARGFYEKSLALRPGNQHAKDMVRKIQERKPQ